MSTPPAPSFLRLTPIRDALAVARPDLHDWSGGAGVVRRIDGGTRYVAESGLRRYGRDQIAAPVAPQREPGLHLEAAVFAGYLYDHYGHFLLESLGRLWPPSPEPPAPLLWIAVWTETFTPWMTDVLDLMGAPADRVIVTSGTGPVEVDELLVPESGFEFGRFMHPWFARRLACVPVEHGEHGEHVWLSRAARRPDSGLDEDAELEDALERRGWRVLRPEALTIRQQVEALAGAVHVAGIEGSAFHTLALLDGFRGAVDLFTRQDHPNFEIVAEVCGLDQVRHRIPGAVPRERAKKRGTDVQWSGVDTAATLRLLEHTCDRHGHAPPA
jgi:hypothetical protein